MATVSVGDGAGEKVSKSGADVSGFRGDGSHVVWDSGGDGG